MAQERAKHPSVCFSTRMMEVLAETISCCAGQSAWSVAAQAIVPTHLHLLITYTTHDIESTVKWLAQQMTKAVHAQTPHQGPVFAKGHWIEYVFEPSHWRNLIAYIDRHKNKAADGIGGGTAEIRRPPIPSAALFRPDVNMSP